MALITPRNIAPTSLDTIPASKMEYHSTAKMRIESDGTVKYRRNDGSYITAPGFMAHCTAGTWTHSFQSGTASTSFGDTSGQQSYLRWNNVGGSNTIGFTTSTGIGEGKYQAPLTGLYTFHYEYLVNTNVNYHIDSGFSINNSSDTFASFVPWQQNLHNNTSANSQGVIGFNRRDPQGTGDSDSNSYGNSATFLLYEGQHVRPMIVANVNSDVQMYGNNHNFWTGSFIGPA